MTKPTAATQTLFRPRAVVVATLPFASDQKEEKAPKPQCLGVETGGKQQEMF